METAVSITVSGSVSVSYRVVTNYIPTTIYASSAGGNDTVVPPPPTTNRSNNVGIIAGAVGAAIAVLALLAGFVFWWKFFKNKGAPANNAGDAGRLGTQGGGLAGVNHAAGGGSGAEMFPPEKPPLSSAPPTFHHGDSSMASLSMGGGEAGSSTSGGGGSGFGGKAAAAAGATNAHGNVVPVVVPAGARKRESDYGQYTIPTPYTNTSEQQYQHHPRSSTDPLISASPRQSSIGGGSLGESTYNTVPPSNENPFAPFALPTEQDSSQTHSSPRSSKAMYLDARMSATPPHTSSTPGSEGDHKRDSLVSSSRPSSPGQKLGRALPSIPGALSSSPPPDREPPSSPGIRPLPPGALAPRPFSPFGSESRPLSPQQAPPPSYDEAERLRFRDSTLSQGGNQL